MTPIPLSLYIHIPWCVHKCPYCDFNSHEMKSDIPEQNYIDALITDLEQELPHIWGRRIHTVFIGGGTPSLFSAEGMEQLLTRIRRLLPIRPDTEITMEANPGTFEQERFAGFLSSGVNRLSLGIQSFSPNQLKNLERIHSADEALNAIEQSRQAGFRNINLDLMFGLPNQSIDTAMEDLQTAIAQAPNHLSWYELTIEPNTLFHHNPPPQPSSDILAEMQEMGIGLLKKAHYEQYEVSAYAQSHQQCQHNLNYWEFGDYIGLGAGAHGKYTINGEITRYLKTKHPRDYMTATQNGNARSSTHQLTEQEHLFEFMLNALRLKAGFSLSLLKDRTRTDHQIIEDKVHHACEKNLLELNGDKVTTTSLGWKFLNETTELFLHD